MDKEAIPHLARIADALERMKPPAPIAQNLKDADAYVWQGEQHQLDSLDSVSRVDLSLIQGVDLQKEILLSNTIQFAKGLSANNALLWGARGMGKSSLIKAVHGEVLKQFPSKIALIEIHREDIPTLPVLLRLLRGHERRFVLFCDDLSFSENESSYKSLKAVLEGGLEGRPENVIIYATSNRRHLMPRDMIENERSTAINPNETVEEKVSLSDRFGLWLGFHACDQETYFAIIDGYAAWLKLPHTREALRAAAIEWSVTRGARSGRVAWQFIQDMAGKAGIKIS
ncbi:MAG: ATP-binding protein [Alphaproteobacteria bacterium]|nr:ATP-binding protein [Alphaproteobacteria bacterium]